MSRFFKAIDLHHRQPQLSIISSVGDQLLSLMTTTLLISSPPLVQYNKGVPACIVMHYLAWDDVTHSCSNPNPRTFGFDGVLTLLVTRALFKQLK